LHADQAQPRLRQRGFEFKACSKITHRKMNIIRRLSEKILGGKKNPCGVPFITPHGFAFLTACAVASGESRHQAHTPGERMLLLFESAGAETPQVVARIPGQIGMRVCTCEICHRPAYACVHWG
jgi:hypothetical protein